MKRKLVKLVLTDCLVTCSKEGESGSKSYVGCSIVVGQKVTEITLSSGECFKWRSYYVVATGTGVETGKLVSFTPKDIRRLVRRGIWTDAALIESILGEENHRSAL